MAWWIHTDPPLRQRALCIEILAEGAEGSLAEARTQAEEALRRVLHDYADEIRTRAGVLQSAADDFRR